MFLPDKLGEVAREVWVILVRLQTPVIWPQISGENPLMVFGTHAHAQTKTFANHTVTKAHVHLGTGLDT